jgi:MFS family permease
MLAPSLPQVMDTFRPHGGDDYLGSFSITVYLIGLALGILTFGPLSDIFGRMWISRVASFWFTVATVACALSSSLESLTAFRFFAGFFGGAPMTIGGAVVADVYPPSIRGMAMAAYTAGPSLGPPLGAVLGSLVSERYSWRRGFWVDSILVSPNTKLCRSYNSRVYLIGWSSRLIVRFRTRRIASAIHSTEAQKKVKDVQTPTRWASGARCTFSSYDGFQGFYKAVDYLIASFHHLAPSISRNIYGVFKHRHLISWFYISRDLPFLTFNDQYRLCRIWSGFDKWTYYILENHEIVNLSFGKGYRRSASRKLSSGPTDGHNCGL